MPTLFGHQFTWTQIAIGTGGVLTTIAACIGAAPVVWGWFSGFDPEISVGSLYIAKAPTGLADNKVAIYLGFRAENASDDAGCIADIAVRLDYKGARAETSWFFPAFYVEIRTLVEQSRKGVDTAASISGGFSPIYLSASSATEKEIAFLHRPFTDLPKDIMTTDGLKPGEYRVDVLASIEELPCSGTEPYESALGDAVGIELSPGLVNSIKGGIVVAPGLAHLDEKRQRLMETGVRLHDR